MSARSYLDKVFNTHGADGNKVWLNITEAAHYMNLHNKIKSGSCDKLGVEHCMAWDCDKDEFRLGLCRKHYKEITTKCVEK